MNRIKTATLIDKSEFHVGRAPTGPRNDSPAAVIRVAFDVEAQPGCLGDNLLMPSQRAEGRLRGAGVQQAGVDGNLSTGSQTTASKNTIGILVLRTRYAFPIVVQQS